MTVDVSDRIAPNRADRVWSARSISYAHAAWFVRPRLESSRVNSTLATNFIWIAAIVVDLGVRIAAIIVIPRNRKPSSAMAWLLAIFLIPYVGILFFLLVGSPKLPRKRREQQAEIDRMLVERTPPQREVPVGTAAWPAWFASVVTMNTELGKLPISGGNSAALLGDYQGSIDAMAAEIDAATSWVHIEFYIVSFDDTTRAFFAAMETAVQRGVTVRVLLDHIASVRAATHKATFAELDRIGVNWNFMLPVQPLKGKFQRPDLRNHRKLVVVDGLVGFMGSQNLTSRDYNSAKNMKRGLKWQELMTRVSGPVVSSISLVFLSDWFSETGEVLEAEHVALAELPVDNSMTAVDCQIVPSGPGYDGENNLRLFLALVTSAQSKVIITSPYFVPDEAMMYAITSACQRGLDVQLFVSEIGDQGPVWHAQRSYYGELLAAGVKIWMYRAPFILHAKHLSIDHDVAVIGSSNMDIRSFALDLEVSLLVRGESFVADMREVEQGYREQCTLLTPEAWAKEPLRSTVLDGLARLTSALQ